MFCREKKCIIKGAERPISNYKRCKHVSHYEMIHEIQPIIQITRALCYISWIINKIHFRQRTTMKHANRFLNYLQYSHKSLIVQQQSLLWRQNHVRLLWLMSYVSSITMHLTLGDGIGINMINEITIKRRLKTTTRVFITWYLRILFSINRISRDTRIDKL